MKKKVIIISSIFLIVMLLLVLIYLFVNSIKKDQQKAKENMIKISDNYKIFNNQVDTFNDKREELAELVNSDNIYYATFYDNSIKIVKVLESYNKIRNEIISQNQYLNKNCNNYYADIEINNMCEVFNNSYNSIDKVFKNDINSYNQTVKKYNEWVKNNSKFKTVNEYVIKEV